MDLVLKLQNTYSLSLKGELKAKEIVRLHKLWEEYLIYLGPGREKVYPIAEEMERRMDGQK